MIERETPRNDEYEDPLWEQARLNGRLVWYHPYSGVLQKEQPDVRRDVLGGIVADEMGLGKTVESEYFECDYRC